MSTSNTLGPDWAAEVEGEEGREEVVREREGSREGKRETERKREREGEGEGERERGGNTARHDACTGVEKDNITANSNQLPALKPQTVS